MIAWLLDHLWQILGLLGLSSAALVGWRALWRRREDVYGDVSRQEKVRKEVAENQRAFAEAKKEEAGHVEAADGHAVEAQEQRAAADDEVDVRANLLKKLGPPVFVLACLVSQASGQSCRPDSDLTPLLSYLRSDGEKEKIAAGVLESYQRERAQLCAAADSDQKQMASLRDALHVADNASLVLMKEIDLYRTEYVKLLARPPDRSAIGWVIGVGGGVDSHGEPAATLGGMWGWRPR